MINLTDTEIPDCVSNILSLGEKFNFSSNLDKKTLFSFLKNVERGYDKFDGLNPGFRKKILDQIGRFLDNSHHITLHDRIIAHNLDPRKRFVLRNSDILFTKADKGNVTVAIKKFEYISKVEESLNDSVQYEKLKESPLNKLKGIISGLIEDWKSEGVLDADPSSRFLGSNLASTEISRAYGLIKVHKANYLVRIIVSSINSPAYRLDRCLANFFNRYIPSPKSRIQNSLEMKELLDDLPVPEEFEESSLDVVSMFPNLFHELILKH